MKTLILFSAGKESVLNLYREKAKYPSADITLLHFNYGQKSYTKECLSLKYYSTNLGINSITKKIDLCIPKSIKTGEYSNNNVYYRNLIFLSNALNIAENNEYSRVLIGSVKNRVYSDGGSEFLADIKVLIKKLGSKVTIDSNTKNIRAEKTIKYLIKECDYSHVWFCDNNHKNMCKECFKCVNTYQDLKKYHLETLLTLLPLY